MAKGHRGYPRTKKGRYSAYSNCKGIQKGRKPKSKPAKRRLRAQHKRYNCMRGGGSKKAMSMTRGPPSIGVVGQFRAPVRHARGQPMNVKHTVKLGKQQFAVAIKQVGNKSYLRPDKGQITRSVRVPGPAPYGGRY